MIDLLDPAAVADPHTAMRQWREGGPVLWSERHRAWLVIGHAELNAAFLDDRLSTERMAAYRERLPDDRRSALEQAIGLLDGWMLFHEPPEHTRLRAPVRRAFTPKAVDALEADIGALVDDLLDRIGDAERVDLVHDFTYPLPAAVIARLFGVPDDQAGWLHDWADRFAIIVFGESRPDRDAVVQDAAAEFVERMGPLMAHYRAEPADNLLAALLAHENELDGLSTGEIVGACSILLFAGHDTTTSLLGSTVAALMTRPEVRAAFCEGSLQPSIAVEEFLRFEPPAKVMVRQAREPMTLADREIAKGDNVLMGIIGANRDPDAFSSPDDLVLDRNPNPHLTFGYGRHFCLGASLARLEARIALPRLFDRFPQMALDGELRWKPHLLDRSLVDLPVRLRAPVPHPA